MRAVARSDSKVAEERRLAIDVRAERGGEGQERSQKGALGREGEGRPHPRPPQWGAGKALGGSEPRQLCT